MRDKLLIALFFISVFVVFLSPVHDIDFPFHLKTGEYIFEHKSIPLDDPFNFSAESTLTDRETFMLSQYWLAQVLFYMLYSISGVVGIIILRAAVLTLFVCLLWFSLKKRGIFSSLLIAIIVSISLLTFTLDRPQYFSFLFTLILVLLFEKFRENHASILPLLFIPLLMLVWSNMHGGFVYGVAIILLYPVTESFKFFLMKMNLRLPVGEPLPAKTLLKLLLACLVAIFASYMNPNGNTALLFVFESSSGSHWLLSGIREYMSPLEDARYPYSFKLANMAFWVLFGFACILVSLQTIRKKSIDITTISLFIFSSYAAFTAIRYIPLFIATTMPLLRDYRIFRDSSFLRDKRLSRVAPVLFAVFFIFMIGYSLKNYQNIFTISTQSLYPEKTVKFLLENRIDANMFNSNNRGNYLIWKLYPYYKVFQDSRYINLEAAADAMAIRSALVSPTQLNDQSLGSALSDLVPSSLGKITINTQDPLGVAWSAQPLWKKLLKKYNIDLIVHEATSDSAGSLFPLTLRLLQDDEWILIYLDGQQQIFIRNGKKYSDIISKFQKPKELIYDEIILETGRLLKKQTTYSNAYSSLGLALLMKGNEQYAQQMIAVALELNKTDLVANFCNAYLKLKKSRIIEKKVR